MRFAAYIRDQHALLPEVVEADTAFDVKRWLSAKHGISPELVWCGLLPAASTDPSYREPTTQLRWVGTDANRIPNRKLWVRERARSTDAWSEWRLV